MWFQCAGDSSGWTGSGNCGLLDLAITIVLDNNTVSEGCTADVQIANSNSAGITHLVLELASGDVSWSFDYVDEVNGVSFAITIAATHGVKHPWLHEPCNPCLCLTCLPPSYCVAIRRYSPTPNEMDCDPCSEIGVLTMDPCDYTGELTLQCGDDSYTVSIYLPPISEGRCAIIAAVSGPDVEIEVDIAGESVTSSTNGCYKCCRNGYPLPISRIGQCVSVSCSDCEAETPEEDNGCGVGVFSQVDYSVEVESAEPGGKRFAITIKELWCDEDCTSTLIDGPQCCFRLQGPIAGAEHCRDNPAALTLSMVAQQCEGDSPDGDSATLVLGTLDASACGASVFQGGWVATGVTFHSCSALAYADIILWCELPADCENELEPGEYCEFAKLIINTGGNALGGNFRCLTPTFCTCDPLFFEFETTMLELLGADPESCPDWCDAGGTLTIRVSE